MSEELRAATKLLEAAFQTYLDACLAIANNNAPTSDNIQQSLAGITNGLNLITSYENKIKQAQAFIYRIRNTLPRIVLISALPDELIARIFRLVIHTQSCSFKHLTSPQLVTPPLHAKALSQVCARWYRVAAQSSGLWSHIDLAPSHRLANELLTRAEISVSRSGQSLLDIHFVEWFVNQDPQKQNLIYQRLGRVCKSIAPRAKSLELTLSTIRRTSYPILPVLTNLFACCVPGTLARLVLAAEHDSSSRCNHFFDTLITTVDSNAPTTASQFNPIWKLDVTRLALDKLLHPVKLLRLDGIFLWWDSQAYHGLVDLRLTCGHRAFTAITEDQLVIILKASPGLEVFHFGLKLKVTDSKNSLPAPVHLDNLRKLYLQYPAQQNVLRLIAPGTGPLKMAMIGSYTGDEMPPPQVDEVTRFFAQANVTHLYLGKVKGVGVNRLLDYLPNLHALRLEYASLHPKHDGTSATRARQDINSLHLMDASIHSEIFPNIACRFQNVTIESSSIYEGGTKCGADSAEKYIKKLTGMNLCQTVTFIRSRGVFQLHEWERDE
ncbi:F-box-like domain containing protein [Ceratobasidium theobromae]|uniref:F-box-like domain containing protein n=1 Tax=Ceratobasidium theobromae TaxID=1582974 RepID=A0A5N5QP06_9AGAM|nr:F-box-like domain containing protein [Ceratobasidium theobromae]